MKRSSFYHTPLHSTPPLGRFRRNIGTPFGMEKLEWCRYPKVKNFEDMFICFDVIHERDRRTDRQTLHDSKDRACILPSRGKNWTAQIKTIKLSLFTYEVTCHIDVVSYGHGVNYLLNAYIITLAYSRDVNNNNNILYYTF